MYCNDDELATKLNLTYIRDRGEIPKGELYLWKEDCGLFLCKEELSLKADFTDSLPRLKQSNLEHEILLKAVRIKGHEGTLKVLDATAGFAEDSLILAAAGFDVTCCEKNEIISALLKDAHARALKDSNLSKYAERLDVFAGDSKEMMKPEKGFDVIYLDPMFPERKKSGLIKKKFQLLQLLESPCDDEEDLFAAAKGAKPKKIVVKRPAKGPYLAGCKPSHSVQGKVIRYDCYINA